MQNYLKVTWVGDGNPPSNIYEYGAGTENPTIPRGILAHRDTTTNWVFQYVYSGKEEGMENYLSTPIWVYIQPNKVRNSDDGSNIGFAYSPDQIPPGAQAEKATLGDVYLFYFGSSPEEKGSNSEQATPKQKERLREGDALRNKNVAISWDADGNVTLRDAENGEGMPLSKLYALARTAGADGLADSLREFAYTKNKKMSFNSYDLFADDEMASFYRNKKFGFLCMDAFGAEGIHEIKESLTDYYSDFVESDKTESRLPESVRGLSDDAWDKAAESLSPQVRPTNPVTSLSDLSDAVDYETSERAKEIKQETDRRLAELQETNAKQPEGSRTSKMLTTEGLSSGRAYFLGATDEQVEEAIMSLPPYAQVALHEMLAPKGNIRYGNLSSLPAKRVGEIIVEHKDHFGDIKRPNARHIGEFQTLVLMQLGQALVRANPDLTLSSNSQASPSFIRRNFPFSGDLGTETEYMVATLSAAMRKGVVKHLLSTKGGDSVKQQALYEQLKSNPSMDINLSDKELVGLIKEGINNMVDTSEYGWAKSYLAEKSGKSEEEVSSMLQDYMSKNAKEVERIKSNSLNSGNTGSATGSPIALKMQEFQDAGVLLGLISAANDNAPEMGISKATKGFDTFMSSMFGDNLDFISEDWFVHTDSQGLKSYLPMGLLHYMAPGLPFYMKDDKLMVIHKGETLDFESQTEEKKREIRDHFASTAIPTLVMGTDVNGDYINTTLGQSSDEFLVNYLNKYQGEMKSDDTKEVKAMTRDDDAIHFTPQNFKDVDSRVYGVALIAEKYMGGLLDVMLDKNIELDEAKVEEMLVLRENSLDDIKSDFLGNMKLDKDTHREAIWEAMKDALKQSRPQMIKDILTRNAKTNLARNLEYLSMIPLIANVAASSNEFSIDRHSTGFHTEELDLNSEFGPLDETISFSGFSLNADGQKHFIAKENRSTGFGDVVHLRKDGNSLLVSPFEIKASRDGEQKSHVSALSPWVNSILGIAKNLDTIKIGKLRDMNIIYEGNKNAVRSFNKDGSERKARGSSSGEGDTMKKLSRLSKRRVGIPLKGQKVPPNAKPKDQKKIHVIALKQLMELGSSEGRGFASF